MADSTVCMDVLFVSFIGVVTKEMNELIRIDLWRSKSRVLALQRPIENGEQRTCLARPAIFVDN